VQISKRVFEIVKNQSSTDSAARVDMFGADMSYLDSKIHDSLSANNCSVKAEVASGLAMENDPGSKSQSSESYKRRTTVIVGRDKFLDVVCDALSEYKYVGRNQREDLILSCRSVHNMCLSLPYYTSAKYFQLFLNVIEKM